MGQLELELAGLRGTCSDAATGLPVAGSDRPTHTGHGEAVRREQRCGEDALKDVGLHRLQLDEPGQHGQQVDELGGPVRVPLTTDPDLWAEAVTLGEQVVWLHTYGETFIGPARPHASIRYPKGDARQPLSRTPITSGMAV